MEFNPNLQLGTQEYVLLMFMASEKLAFTGITLIGSLYLAVTAWKLSKYGGFSGPYFPAFGTDTDI